MHCDDIGAMPSSPPPLVTLDEVALPLPVLVRALKMRRINHFSRSIIYYLLYLILVCFVVTEHNEVHDAFSQLMQRQPLLAVYARRKDECEKIFAFYAAADKSLENVKQSSTMNIREMSELCDDAKLYDNKFGVRQLVDAFVRVNIEDDVYVQANKANTSTELVFDEFFEVLARMFHTRDSAGRRDRTAKRLLETGGDDAGLELARGFDAWLETSFLPAATLAVKTRRKAGQRT